MNTVLEPSFVLHRRSYRNTSALVELLTLNHGRVGLVARGVLGAKSPRAGQLQPFRPLLCAWTGRGELGTLTTVEDGGPGPRPAAGQALIAGFYLNELCMLLLHRDAPVSRVFQAYGDCVGQLISDANFEQSLRRFEWVLLQELGVAVPLTFDLEDAAINPDASYTLVAEQGFKRVEAHTQTALIRGHSLLRFEAGDADLSAIREMRWVTRACIDALLNGRPLRSRELARQQTRAGVSRA